MYILTFNKSRSIYFEKGLRLAQKLGGVWDGKTLSLEIPDDQLLFAYDRLLGLFSIIQNWSSLKATYNGQDVNPYRFILSMHFLQECAENALKDQENCFCWPGVPGWGCKKLSNVFYLERGNGNYNSNEKYWYNFGSFRNKNEWVIDKIRLLNKLLSYAAHNGFHVCPHFSEQDVKKAVDELPVKVIPDNINYRFLYEEEFHKGELIKIPINIRHISNEFPDEVYEKRPRYDMTKIQIIRRFETGEISKAAMEELLRKYIGEN